MINSEISSKLDELGARLALSASVAKSLKNRLASGFEKEGTVAQIFASTSASLFAFANSERVQDEQEQMQLEAIALIFAIGNDMAKAAKAVEKSARREVWADSQAEAQKLAKASKPSKPSLKASPEFDGEQLLSMLAQLIEQRA